ncbi:MAG: O-methyltransferase [bacterium]
MDILNPEISRYLEQLTPERPPVLQEMEAYAREHKFPIIGPQVGHFLQQLVILTDAKRIFEMGSGYGYSALWMALAMGSGGRIECCEFDSANIERGRQWLALADVSDKVAWHQGDAREAIKETQGPFDIILNDIDKEWYPEALRLAWPELRPGGVMVTDNALWSGRVVTQNPPAESTVGVRQVNLDAYAVGEGVASLLPLRDGLLVITKKRA